MTLDPSVREQLVGARERIVAQLDEIDFRANGGGDWEGHCDRRLPDYSDVAAELRAQLREINSVLGHEDETNA